jgi:hypothetical protein
MGGAGASGKGDKAGGGSGSIGSGLSVGAKAKTLTVMSDDATSAVGSSGFSPAPLLASAAASIRSPNDPAFGSPAGLVLPSLSTTDKGNVDAPGDKPWRRPNVDLSDYFNYGFNEATWREYNFKQASLRAPPVDVTNGAVPRVPPVLDARSSNKRRR